MAECPCRGCENRQVGCHSKCENYIDWTAETRAKQSKIYKEKMKYAVVNSYEIKETNKALAKIRKERGGRH